MDLAKIRKKSLLTLCAESDNESRVAPVRPVAEPTRPTGSMDSIAVPSVVTPRVTALSALPSELFDAAPLLTTASFTAVTLPPSCGVSRYNTPLEAILAGRSAAGCNDDALPVEDELDHDGTEASHEFLCFRVSDEIYGINIMDIKEIIKPREVTDVPRTPVFVAGILSLRGTIIPIIDMRIRLGLAQNENAGKERIIVIKNRTSFSGLMVDEVIQVVQVPAEHIEAVPTVLDAVNRDFISGIGHADGRLIIILHLENVADIDFY
jgi:purine-binding chemotaxis protein CheW